MLTLTRTATLQKGANRHRAFEYGYERLIAIIIDDKASLRKPWSAVSPQPVLPETIQSLRLRDYLNEVAWAGDVSRKTADQAWETWLHLSRVMYDRLPVPDAAPGQDGELLLTWDRGELHLELELRPDGPAEFFSRNRMTGVLWGEDYQPDAPLSEGAQKQLGMFL